MNAFLSSGVGDWWQLASWTMLHFLWLGTLAGLVALVLRLAIRRASANVRYGVAVMCLALLAAMPLGIAEWLAAESQFGREIAAKPKAVGGALEGARGTEHAVARAPVIDATVTTPMNESGTEGVVNPPAMTPSPLTSPQRLPSLPENFLPHLESVVVGAAPYLPWLWIVGTPLTFLLLTTGLVGAERLRRASRILHDGPVADACSRLCESLRIGRRVTVAVCERIATPVLVGIVRPIILLPPAALTGWSPEEIEMVLLHELAHVRRWDNLINLVQRIVESVLFFHPAVWLVSSWVRREREACCDAVVVGRTQRPQAYAEFLVSLAAQFLDASEPGRPRPRHIANTRGRGRPGSLVSSAMAAGPLRGRIRRILGIDDDPMLVSGKSLAMVMSGLLLVATLVVLNLPTRTLAEQESGLTTERAEGLTTEDTEGTETIDGADTLTAERLQIDGTVIEADDGRVVARNQESADNWPMGIVFSSPMEGEISRWTWERLGLKVMPATATDLKAAGIVKGIKVVGGLPVPPSSKSPLFLTNVNGVDIKDFRDLAIALGVLNPNGITPPEQVIERGDQVIVECLADTESGPGELKFIVNADKVPTEISLERSIRKFPSLEEQKLADLAWKRLGLELETIGAEDLQRVRALGYDGGVKVISTTDRMESQPLQGGDLLVGLHVWPTTSLQAVVDVLTRDDLAELNPLKFYVVRSEQRGMGGKTEDLIQTGRISVVQPASDGHSRTLTREGMDQLARRGRSTVESMPQTIHNYSLPAIRLAVPGEPPPPINPADYGRVWPAVVAPNAGHSELQIHQPTAFRYNARTFDEWLNEWRTELSTENRLQAVKALAAFGASGKGQEVAEAIIEVAPQYGLNEWMEAISVGHGEDPPPGRELLVEMLHALSIGNGGQSPFRIPFDDTLVALESASRSDDVERRQLAAILLGRMANNSKAEAALLPLMYDENESVRGLAVKMYGRLAESKQPAIDRLKQVIEENPSSDVVERVREAIKAIEAMAANKQEEEKSQPGQGMF